MCQLYFKYLKIISGTKTGPAIARATFVDGATADMKEPNASEHCTTKIMVTMHTMNRCGSLFKLPIQ